MFSFSSPFVQVPEPLESFTCSQGLGIPNAQDFLPSNAVCVFYIMNPLPGPFGKTTDIAAIYPDCCPYDLYF
jgi:hypothetical protein